MAARLTPKQEKFCQLIAEAPASGMSNGECYQKAYNSKATKKSCQEKASQMLRDVKIQSRVAEIRKPAVESAQCSLQEHLDELARLRDMGVAMGQVSAAVTAEMARGKVSGHYTDKVEINGTIGRADDRTLDQLIAEYAAEAGVSLPAGGKGKTH